ncbi:MAG TPA: tetratricopeptide repeat protein [Streptosporangiaceae bacterium]|nr:tetratricopeptide repeat protein [Streptosporangiaceae bacterium]
MKGRCVLAILLLNLGTIVPVDVLIDRVWDADPPPKARESLSSYVTRLRRVLREAGGNSEQLAGRARGYVLDADPETVDLCRFRQLRRQAIALADSSDPEHAVLLLREADALWRGQALAGLSGESISRLQHSLEEERRAATLERIELELALGRDAELVADLEQLSDRFSLDESFAAHRMTALYRSGRLNDALRVYRDIRRGLIGELGTEPGPALSDLHARILRRDPGLAVTVAREQLSRPPRTDTLPRGAGQFVGRAEEIRLLTMSHDDASRVHIITGMPGVGKTALAVEAARLMAAQYPDGQLFVTFGTHDPQNRPLDPASALHRLLRQIGVPTSQIPQEPAERAALWRRQMARRRAVVVLDDVAGPEQIRLLLPSAGKCRVLITGRRRMDRFGDARMLVLSPMPASDAIELFTQVAGPASATEPAAIAEIVELCGRLPLVIQLAASGVREGHPAWLADLIEELSHPTATLGSTAVIGQRIAAAFEVSYRSLAESHRLFFRRLGLHPGAEITAAAAAALGGDSAAEADASLAVLVDHHLLQCTGRYFHFHDLVRRFAADCAMREDAAPVRRRAFGRLLDYYLATADQASRLLYPHSRRVLTRAPRLAVAASDVDTTDRAANWMDLEWRNILHAARYACVHEQKQQCADLTLTLTAFLEAEGHWGEALAVLALALQASRDIADLKGIAAVSLALSVVSSKSGHYQDALRHGEEAVAVCRSLADRPGEAAALDQLGIVHRGRARYREALAYHQEASDLYRAAADQLGVADTQNRAGIACYHLGRYQEAISRMQAALALYRRVGDLRGEAKAINNLGNMQRYLGYHRDALQSYQRALEIFAVIGGEQNQGILHHNIGAIYHYKTNFEQALAAFRRALAIYRRIDDPPGIVTVMNDIGEVCRHLGHSNEALIHHQRAMAMAGELDNSYEMVIALRGIADVRHGQGRHDEALDHYQDALRRAREIGEPYQEGMVLDGIAETVFQIRGPGEARIYWHQALDAFGQLGVPEAEAVRLRLDTLPPEQS